MTEIRTDNESLSWYWDRSETSKEVLLRKSRTIRRIREKLEDKKKDFYRNKF